MTPGLITTADIDRAAARIDGHAVRTPLVDVSWRAERPLWLKCESLQVTGSFKVRGAFNMVANLPEPERRQGVITYSSGNHAQAVAYAARCHRTGAVVVMPVTAPAVKVEGARRFGAEVVFEGTTSLERRSRAERILAERGLTMIPPFDHPDVIAGQGTVGREIASELPSVGRVFVPVGGGGLVSGVASALAASGSGVEVVGVEPIGAAKMTASLAAGRPVTLERVSSVADGLLPVRPADLTFAHVQSFVSRVVTVDDEAIERALAWLVLQAKLVVEPSGAAATAAALEQPVDDVPTVAVVSGGNVAPDVLVTALAGQTDDVGPGGDGRSSS